ncbi:probable vacuolar amino acid transporter YPQ1 [Phalaenopsis equestris]|uniref:probable vacuolar amino acid transporter YPQ1 n=1 Tax=Phalaenopsis equestris TaxID=78828 RepID=UPI0009E6433A|nr:probable vacuolar amino acid transporter YPQ1 [Phalaenopsis equestris]
MFSLLFWGTAEVPQIVTNFRTKSGHGVSIALLLTWFIGDIFNLVGCRLEPVTLPTQYYTALLYTAVTVVLILQTFYYDYYGRLRKANNSLTKADDDEDGDHVEAMKKPLIDPKRKGEVKAVPTKTSNRGSPRTDTYYMSARSLTSSTGTPSYLQTTHLVGRFGSGPSTVAAMHDSSSDEEEDTGDAHFYSNLFPKPTSSTASGYAALIIGSAGLPSQASAFTEANIGRRILKNTGLMTMGSNPYGMALGWVMAAIYMGGRLPQIYLNIKRGGVEGLNPLMFTFAIIANATYVGSILMRSTEWNMLKANAPWLLDAVVCVLLDLFIILQFAYYKFAARRATDDDLPDSDDVSNEAKKILA